MSRSCGQRNVPALDRATAAGAELPTPARETALDPFHADRCPRERVGQTSMRPLPQRAVELQRRRGVQARLALRLLEGLRDELNVDLVRNDTAFVTLSK